MKTPPAQAERVRYICAWVSCYVISAFLNFHTFYITLENIDWDEVGYINSGRTLGHIQLPAFAWNPLISLFYRCLFTPFAHSPVWLVQEARLGHFLIFTLLWSVGYFVSNRLLPRSGAVFAAILLLGFPFYDTLLNNSTDALFACLSGIALGFALNYLQSRRLVHIAAVSLILALAAMTRDDGVVMELCFLIAVLIIEHRWANSGVDITLDRKLTRLAKITVTALLPFVLLTGGYLLLTKIETGSVQLGLQERTYEAFQQGEGIAYFNPIHHSDWDPYDEGFVMSNRTYGVGASNHWSIVDAVVHHPHSYLNRLVHLIRYLPGTVLEFVNDSDWSYGFTTLLLGAALCGMVILIDQKNFDQAIVLALWHLHLCCYFFTFFREGYFLLPIVTLTALSAVGLSVTLRKSRVVQAFIIAFVNFPFVLGGFVLQQTDLLYGTFAAALPVAVSFLSNERRLSSTRFRFIASVTQFVLLFALAILVHWPIDFSAPPGPGNSDEAAASVYIENSRSTGAVAGYDPGAATMSKRVFVDLSDASISLSTRLQVEAWMRTKGIGDLILDPNMTSDQPYESAIIQSDLGKGLTLKYRSPDGQYEVISQRTNTGG